MPSLRRLWHWAFGHGHRLWIDAGWVFCTQCEAKVRRSDEYKARSGAQVSRRDDGDSHRAQA